MVTLCDRNHTWWDLLNSNVRNDWNVYLSFLSAIQNIITDVPKLVVSVLVIRAGVYDSGGTTVYVVILFAILSVVVSSGTVVTTYAFVASVAVRTGCGVNHAV